MEGKVAAASPELAKAREEAAARDRFIRMTRVNKHGIATMTIRDHITTLLGSDLAVSVVARALEKKMPGAGLNERRLAAFALLTNPDSHPGLDLGPVKPKVRINLHLAPGSPIARMEGHGPVTTAWVQHLWRDPYGAHYLVDHTGTRKLSPAEDLGAGAD